MGQIQFREPHLTVLRRSGWFPGRKADISSWIATGRLEGWPEPNELQCEVLEQLGHLRLAIHSDRGEYPFIVDPDRFWHCDPSHILDIADEGRRLGETLYPFAEFLVAAPYWLFITPTGRIVMAMDSPSSVYGKDIYESLNTMFFDLQSAVEF